MANFRDKFKPGKQFTPATGTPVSSTSSNAPRPNSSVTPKPARIGLVLAALTFCLLAAGAYVFENAQQLGLTLPSWQELEHRADVAAGQSGEKSVSKWKDFLSRTWKFAEENPDVLNIWLLRGVAAFAVNDQAAGQEAAHHLLRFVNKSENPTTEKLLKALWAKQWVQTANLDFHLAVTILNELLKSRGSESYYSLDDSVEHLGEHDVPGLRFSGHEHASFESIDFPVETVQIEAATENHSDYYCKLTANRNVMACMSPGGHIDYLSTVNIRFNDRGSADLAADLLKHLSDLAKNSEAEH
jgi:hypothetical protein